MTIELWIVGGAIIGLAMGSFVANPKYGCLPLMAIPPVMIGFVAWSHATYPEMSRSTSGLDYLFGPLWPSLGGCGGYLAGRILRSVFGR